MKGLTRLLYGLIFSATFVGVLLLMLIFVPTGPTRSAQSTNVQPQTVYVEVTRVVEHHDPVQQVIIDGNNVVSGTGTLNQNYEVNFPELAITEEAERAYNREEPTMNDLYFYQGLCSNPNRPWPTDPSAQWYPDPDMYPIIVCDDSKVEIRTRIEGVEASRVLYKDGRYGWYTGVGFALQGFDLDVGYWFYDTFMGGQDWRTHKVQQLPTNIKAILITEKRPDMGNWNEITHLSFTYIYALPGN